MHRPSIKSFQKENICNILAERLKISELILLSQSNVLNAIGGFKRLISQKICTACSRTSYNIVSLTYWNKYIHNDTNETEVNINIGVNNDRGKW